MSTVPLAALNIQTPPNPVSSLRDVMAIRNMQQGQQLQQQQIQGAQQENQIRQLQIDDAQKVRQLAPQFVTRDEGGKVDGYDWNGFQNAAMSAGIAPGTVAAIGKSQAEYQLSLQNLTEKQRQNQEALNKFAFNSLENIRGVQDPQQRQNLYTAALKGAAQMGSDVRAYPQQVPDDNGLSTIEAGLGMHAQALSDAKDIAETQKNAQQANEAAVNAALGSVKLKMVQSSKPGDFDTQIDSLAPANGPTGPLNRQMKTMVNGALSRGDYEAAQRILTDGFNQIGEINKETNPSVIQARAQSAAIVAQAVEPLRQKILSDFQNNKDARDKIEANVLKPYQDKMSSIAELQSALGQAQQGNVTAARGALLKLMGVTNPDGTKRYNEAEAARMLSQGSIPRRFAGAILNGLTGNNWTAQVISDMQQFATGQAQVASQTLNSGIDNVNRLYNTSVGGGLKQNSNLPNPASGMTRIKASDGTLHDIPSANLAKARKIDPGLQVVQ